MTDEKQRTPQQNKAVHLWFDQLADELNASGYEQKITIGTVDTPWSKDTVKVVFAKIAKAQFGKYHTAELTTKELTEVSETLNRALAQQGIHIPFPSIQEILFNQDTRN